MPRRKPVNPQPKLKQEDEREDTKTGNRFGEEDEDEPPEKKALTETPDEERAKYDPTGDVNSTTVNLNNDSTKTSKTEMSDVKDIVPDIVKSDDTNLKADDSVKTTETGGQSSSAMKCNQSLQALFEAAHSELQNISKQGDRDAADNVATQQSVVQMSVPNGSDLTSALKSGQIVIIQCDTLDPGKTVGPQVLQQIVMDKKGTGKFHLPAEMSNIELVSAEKPSDHVYGTSTAEVTPGDSLSYKVNEALKPTLAKSTFVIPRMPTETIVAVPVASATTVGRKRKHPQKPGKHICRYCGRGCAKPSVLQKHIRAHTGERPYPCIPCGFSFKTKSNLYKHCKSRAHAIKMGLLTAPPDTGNNSAPKEDKSDEISDESDDDMTPESTAVELKMDKAFVPKPVQGTDQSMEKSSSDSGDNKFLVVQPEGATVETLTPLSASASEKAVIGDCQYYDVTFMTVEGTLQTISLPAQLAVPVVPKTQATTTTSTTPQVIIIKNPDEKLAVNTNTHVEGVATSMKNIVVSVPSVPDCKSFNSVTMKTETNATLLPRQSSFSSNRVRLTPTALPSGDQAPPATLNSNQPISRVSLTPEMLHDRITQLISSNAAIVDTPMADAPRPKRVSRHNSMFEPMLVSSSQVSMTTAPVLPSSSAPVLPPEAARKPTKLTPTKSDGSNFLGLVEPSDQPPGSSGKPLSSGSGAGLSYTTTMSTNEIKIQIRLPKPITTTVATSASVNVISSSMAQVGQSGGVTAPVMAVERSVIKDLLLKGRSQSLPSTVVLQTPGGEPVVGEAPSSDGQHAVACAACHQTFYNASLMDEHLKQSCPLGGAVKLGPVYVVMAPEPTLLSPATTMLVTSSVSHVAAITPINVTTTTTKPNLKTHTVVMTTAMTGGSTMLLEVVDPTLPPKRGRPKGSRNSYNSPASKPSPIPDLALFPTYPSLAPRPPRESQPDSVTLKPPGRPPRPVLRLKIPPPHGFATSHVTKGSQSAGVSPGSTSDLPTTPITSFAKLKLKGKILMKRSMSVERMLLQDKPGSVGLSTGSSVSNLPHSSCIQSTQVPQKFLANLRRCESLDESMPLAKRARLQERSDSGKLDSLLYKMLMKGLISSTQAGSTTIIANSVPTVTKPAQPVIPSTTGGNIPDVIVIDDGPTEVDTQLADTSGSSGATTGVVMYPPAKVGMTLASRLGMGNVAPFARGISADVMLHFPSVKSLPDNLVSGIPGRLLRVITGSTLGLDTDSTVEAGAMTHDRDDKGKDEGSSRRTPDSQMAKTDLSEARPDVQRLSTKCSLTRQLSTAEKSAAVQLLLSHSCPILCNRTHVTFCTVVKPQPIYVSQVTERLSMYSNWKTTPTDGQDSKLTSRMMLSLYETHRRTESPYYMNCSRPVSILTHSSYWNGVSSPPPAPPIVTAQCNPPVSELKPASKSSNEPDLFSVALNEVEVTCENVSSETTAAAPGDRIVRMLHESVAPPIDAPKRVVIFSGGYKTSEEYVYIRGRGRGRYVCERCGIRCKKPSMLKKHIRTHTDLRPYHCYYCSFSFKTKGNLTKHMKSKAHHKKCLELGIFPIPTVVDETHIDSSALDQQNQVAEDYRSRILGVSTDDTDGSHVTDDNDGDDDDDDDDDNGDDDEEEDDTESDAEMVIDDEAESVNSRSDVRYTAVVPDGSTEATFLKMKTGAKSESNRDSLTGGSTKFTGQVKGQPPRASIDKEIAASLLDLSKGTEDVCKMSITSTEYGLGHTGKVGKLTPTIWESVSTNHLVNSREDSAAAAECCSPPVGAATDGVPTMSLDEIPDHISPASREWLDNMKAFCERAHTQRSTAEHEYNIGARFVPPPPLGGVPVKTSTELAANIASVHQTVNSPMTGGPIVGHFIKQDVSLASILSLTLTDTVSSAMALPMMMTQSSPVTSPTACIAIGNGLVTKSGDTCISNSKTVVSKEFVKQTVQHAPLDSVEKVVAMPTVSMTTVTTTMTQPTQTIPFHLLGLHGLPAVVPSEIPLGVLLVTTASTTPSTSSSSSATMVQFVTGDNRAPYEIIPIPGRVNDNSANLVDGKYVCSVCGKTFSKQHQLTLHKNIHYFERPFKCTDCSLSFRTKGHLEKHHKSEGHQLKVKIVERSQAVLVTTTSGTSADNPRPFRCDDCNVAFRIHGHLAKHLRSKLHIMMLEKLGKVPPGAYALIEKNGSFKEVVATDCESSLQCIRQLLVNLESGDSTSHSVCDGDSVTHIPVEINQSAAADAGQTSTVSEGAVNSFVYRRAGEFEKVTNASNDRVTVERKAELIDFGEFVPETDTASQLTGEGCAGLTERVKESEKNRKGGGRGSSVKATVSASEQSEHKCGLCSSSFTDIASLKYHLVTHTELRPHVCEYCDAGFTTAQSLTFHLRTHTQERPYLCGRCGDTFACLSQLQQHLLVHTSQSPGGATQQPPGGATQKSSGGATQQSPSEATQPAAPVVTTATTGHCSEVAQNKQTVLPSSDGNVNQEDAIDDAVCRQKDVSKSNDAGCLSVVESDVIVTRSCVEILSSHTVLSTASRQLQSATSVTMAPLLHSNSGFAVTNNNTIAADGNRCPVLFTAGPSIIVSSSSPSPGQHRENHLSRTPSIQTHKRRCLQRQFALSGEDVAIAAVTTSLSDGNKASCVTTAAIVATPVNDIGQHSSTQEHSYIGLDHTEQSEIVPRCSSAVP